MGLPSLQRVRRSALVPPVAWCAQEDMKLSRECVRRAGPALADVPVAGLMVAWQCFLAVG